jgi:plastocyanin
MVRRKRIVLAGLALAGVTMALALVGAARGVSAAGRGPVGVAVGQVDEQVGKSKPRPVAGAVVYLAHVSPGKGRRPRSPQAIQQRDLKFEPKFTVVMKGDTLSFPNNERNAVDHNVYSPRTPGRVGFNLGRYGRGVSKTWTFNQPGVYDIYCDLHEDMRAQVKVLENEYYTYTDATGAFRLEDVPEGDYEIRVWRPYTVEASGTLHVSANAVSAPVELVFKNAPTPPRHHTRFDGSAYSESYD